MKNRTRPQAARIEAEYQARRAAAVQAAKDKREMDEAVSRVETELGGVSI